MREIAAKVRERADDLEAQAEKAESPTSRLVILFGCVELHKVADMIDTHIREER